MASPIIRPFNNPACHSDPFASCHSEEAKRPKNLAQGKLREESTDPSIAQGDLRVTIKPPSIIHVDLDAFFVSVEQALDPTLRGKPVIVGSHSPRGVVSSASYEARSYGVSAGMPLTLAHRLCPQAIFLQGDFSQYYQASQKFMDILKDMTPDVEPLGLDEAYLDVSGFGLAREIALKMKRRIKQELDLTASVGIASCKVVAKVASDLAKPDGLLEVAPREERSFFAPLSVGKLPGVGKKTKRVLEEMGVTTIGQLAALPSSVLRQTFGVAGETLHRYANGVDESRVEPVTQVKSIGRETTFAQDTLDRGFLEAMLRHLSEQVGTELRGQDKQGRCITLKLKYDDFETITRSRTLRGATNRDHTIFEIGNQLLQKTLPQSQRLVRLIGIRVSNLTGVERQLEMLDATANKLERVDKAVEHIRQKHGFASIQTGRTLTLGNTSRTPSPKHRHHPH
jgi:DNA polymerase-4